MKLKDDVVITLHDGFKTIKGYIITNNPNYAITNEIDKKNKQAHKG